jgi:hypothetical protein
MESANQLKSMGRLIIIAIGTNVNATELDPFNTYVFEWKDYNNPPSDLALDINRAFKCDNGKHFI